MRPLERGKGYGTALLGLTLRKACEIGLREVLVTCDSGNIASVRIIEKNGGRLLGTTISDRTGELISRYRFALAEPGNNKPERAGQS